METIRPTTPAASSGASARAGAAERLVPAIAPQAAGPAPAAALAAPAPLRRGLSNLEPQLQGEVASTQQALDFLEQVTAQLQALKAELSAKLANHQGDQRQLEARLRQLSDTLARRQQTAGANLDAQLDFSTGAPASQRFRMRGLDLAALQAGPPQELSFSIGGASLPLAVSIEPGLSREQVAQRFDRALAPAKVRASVGSDGGLVFSTPEQGWPMVRDSLALNGRGQVATEAEAAAISPQAWGTDSVDALRRSLHEVVQALAQVQRARDAASQALSAAASRVATAQPAGGGVELLAQDFANTAGAHDYESLLALTSALVGISRERVMSLLGLR
jgi:hypothetical protein